MAALAPGDNRSHDDTPPSPVSTALSASATRLPLDEQLATLTIVAPHAIPSVSPTAPQHDSRDPSYDQNHNEEDDHNEIEDDAESFHSSTSTPPPAGLPPVISPPYWQHNMPPHRRGVSQASIPSAGKQPAHIRLEDNTEAPPEGVTSPLWARAVRIGAHAVVEGTVRGVGDYVVWICNVETYDGGTVVLRRRYSEFEALREQLRATFPYAAASLPAIPPKSVLYKFRPAFLEKRRQGLEFFLNCVLLNPEFASSALLKEFVFS